jgi:hypothetical protein
VRCSPPLGARRCHRLDSCADYKRLILKALRERPACLLFYFQSCWSWPGQSDFEFLAAIPRLWQNGIVPKWSSAGLDCVLMKRALLMLVLCSLALAQESNSCQDKGTTPCRIHAGDLLDISVLGEPNLSMSFRVRSDGKISFPLLNDIQAAGLTPDELGRLIRKKLRPYVASPHVSVKEMYVIERHLPDWWPMS